MVAKSAALSGLDNIVRRHRPMARFVGVPRRYRLTFWRLTAIDMLIVALVLPMCLPLPLLVVTEPCIVLALYLASVRAGARV